MNATIQALYMPALAQFAGKNDIRLYLNGFIIEPAPENIGGVYLIATDGHTGCVVHDPKGSSDGIYIVQVPYRLASRCKPHKGKDHVKGDKLLTFDGKMATLSDSLGFIAAEKCEQIDGKVIDWRKAMLPKTAQELTPTMVLNSEYLARINTALMATGIWKCSWRGIRVIQQGAGSPVLFFPNSLDEHKIYFVVMGMRDDMYPLSIQWTERLVQKWEPPVVEPAPTETISEGGDCD